MRFIRGELLVSVSACFGPSEPQKEEGVFVPDDLVPNFITFYAIQNCILLAFWVILEVKILFWMFLEQ